MAKLLILGGTSEGRALAEKIATALPKLEVISALAGATNTQPDLPGQVRVGGFGGAIGLAAYLKDQGVSCLIDATHP
ncbi:precorrin-6A/cobalt-precorrin-6A reductase, partial [Pseudomonadota bacterium]